MSAQNAIANRVKGAAPERRDVRAQNVGHAAHHFLGCFVREYKQEDALRRNALFEQIGDAVNQCARFSRSSSGNDERRPGHRRHGGMLLRVQFARVVDLQFDRGAERLQRVLTRHARNLTANRRMENGIVGYWNLVPGIRGLPKDGLRKRGRPRLRCMSKFLA